jgi:hypothetical protein
VNDVEIDGRKVYGSAQIDWYNAFVHSGTFLVNTDLDVMAQALRPPPIKFADKPSHGIRDRVVNLSEVAGSTLRVDEVAGALSDRLGDELGVELVPGVLSEHELSAARHLFDSKYGQREWTFRGPQSFSTVLSTKAQSGVVTMEANLRGGAIERVQLRGDFLIADQRQLDAVMARLRGARLRDAAAIAAGCALPEDVRDAIGRLLGEIGASSGKETG